MRSGYSIFVDTVRGEEVEYYFRSYAETVKYDSINGVSYKKLTVDCERGTVTIKSE